MKEKLLVIDVSHGTTHDGPGMRTTIFTKGCSLHCQWCQNPESIAKVNDIWWTKNDCIGCFSCINACPNHALTMTKEGLIVSRKDCQKCGNCVEICPSTAISWQGIEYDMETLLKEIMRYKSYYSQFQGGVTCSGGEPLLQSEFIKELFKILQKDGISTAIDTCGFVPRKNLEEVLPYTNYILYDLKIFKSEKHKQYTGFNNELILDNLLYVADYIRNENPKIKLWIRTPLIPNVTVVGENIQEIGEFIKTNLSDIVERWELCAFNGVCVTKYDKLGQHWQFDGVGTMSEADIVPIRQIAESLVLPEKVLISGMIRSKE